MRLTKARQYRSPIANSRFDLKGASVSSTFILEPLKKVSVLREHTCSFYASLGAILDFHDDLIHFAYQRQIDTDPGNTPYYLECLQDIAEGRKSEALHTLAAIEASSDKISLKDVREAFKSFGLDFASSFLEDDIIIGNFQSRVSDAPRQEAELRRALKIIGQHRSSEKIQQVASNGRCVLAMDQGDFA